MCFSLRLRLLRALGLLNLLLHLGKDVFVQRFQFGCDLDSNRGGEKEFLELLPSRRQRVILAREPHLLHTFDLRYVVHQHVLHAVLQSKNRRGTRGARPLFGEKKRKKLEEIEIKKYISLPSPTESFSFTMPFSKPCMVIEKTTMRMAR